MNVKHTALFLVLWLVCQQVGAAIAALAVLPLQDASPAGAHMVCHSSNETAHALEPAKSVNASHTHGQPEDPAMGAGSQCCDINCKCCVGGCHSVLTTTLCQNGSASSYHPDTFYLFVLPQTPLRSLFRPPIAA